jgi:hypothetical protein
VGSAIGLLVAGMIAATSWLATDHISGLLQLEAAAREELAAILPGDAARSAAVGLLGLGLAIAVMRARLRPQLAATLLALVVAVDPARAGAGLNRRASPLVSPCFRKSPPSASMT